MKIYGVIFTSALAMFFVSLFAQPAKACASALFEGTDAKKVRINSEDTLIVWDGSQEVEHFIREVSFDAKVKSFGFIVPTPTRPELADADRDIFRRLRVLLTPRDVMLGAGRSKSASPSQGVVVLEEKQVAGLDAAVLAADDVGALGKWLKANGFASRPALMEWLKPYVQSKWIITAFKYAKSKPKAERLQTSALRMSFKTKIPFYPYREPKDSVSGDGRHLNLYLISSQRLSPRLGVNGPETEWHGEQVRFARVSDSKKLLSGVIPTETIPQNMVVESYFDKIQVRPAGKELYFPVAADQNDPAPKAAAQPRKPEKTLQELQEFAEDSLNRKKH